MVMILLISSGDCVVVTMRRVRVFFFQLGRQVRMESCLLVQIPSDERGFAEMERMLEN